ncbi:hypothetical protein LEP1GSC052_3906 [Leptospira kmetyi serovar Malaysia str. Bejo-Iso9]|nr:hypothetical protein LEP1GSC052_3906 [Leptospira kmetyi serovar Malaysia str. Bejo-Iso9]
MDKTPELVPATFSVRENPTPPHCGQLGAPSWIGVYFFRIIPVIPVFSPKG